MSTHRFARASSSPCGRIPLAGFGDSNNGAGFPIPRLRNDFMATLCSSPVYLLFLKEMRNSD